MRPFIILTLCFSLLVASNPVQLAAQKATIKTGTTAGVTKMSNAEFRRIILEKARSSNMTVRQRLKLRTGLAFFGDEIQEAVEARLALDGKGIGDGDIDWAKLFEQILEFIKLLLELFGTTDNGDVGIIIGDNEIMLTNPIVNAPIIEEPIVEPIVDIVPPAPKVVETPEPKIVMREAPAPTKSVPKTVVQQKPIVIPTVPMRTQSARIQPPIRRQSRVIYQYQNSPNCTIYQGRLV